MGEAWAHATRRTLIQPSKTRNRRRSDLFLHLVRGAVAAVALAVSTRLDGAASLLVATAGAAGIFMAAFSLAHDATHGALGLGRLTNRIVLGFAGLLMVSSGHAMRVGHAMHHADPLGPRDVEGAPARGSLARAIVFGPVDAWRLRLATFRAARRAERPVILVESLVGLALAACALTSGIRVCTVYALVAIVLQLSIGAWAAWVPHNAPAWLVRAARFVAKGRSVVLLSLAYHDLHHRRPSVPCARLGEV
ncbi:MAG TPA: fatty acid desaturase [Polyangiaceae bacterium]|nr:fatty acid desaturase [Polyangiaceae bacterium]